MTFVVINPGRRRMLPGVELTPKLSLVPILGTSLLCKSLSPALIIGISIAIIFASTASTRRCSLHRRKMFQRESVLFRS